MGPDGQPILVPQWKIPPGAKTKRAKRVSEYLNTVLFYRMDNWEDDTDALLMQLPAVGCVFRKIWVDEQRKPQTATVSALNLVVPQKTRNLKTALRITEKIEDVYPHEIRGKMRSGFYREAPEALGVSVDPDKGAEPSKENDDGARLLLEQHCLWDFDGDGLEEPYIVTVDHETRMVLRIEPNFGPDDIKWVETDRLSNALTGDMQRVAVSIDRREFYVKYSMFPHPGGSSMISALATFSAVWAHPSIRLSTSCLMRELHRLQVAASLVLASGYKAAERAASTATFPANTKP
jgi:chaperonin GroES